MNKKFDKNGLPLKIKAEWTNDTYHYRTHKNSDDLQAETVEGWLVRINGFKFPRPRWNNDVDGDFFDYPKYSIHRFLLLFRVNLFCICLYLS